MENITTQAADQHVEEVAAAPVKLEETTPAEQVEIPSVPATPTAVQASPLEGKNGFVPLVTVVGFHHAR